MRLKDAWLIKWALVFTVVWVFLTTGPPQEFRNWSYLHPAAHLNDGQSEGEGVLKILAKSLQVVSPPRWGAPTKFNYLKWDLEVTLNARFGILTAKLMTIKDRRNMNPYQRNQRGARGKTGVFCKPTQPSECLVGWNGCEDFQEQGHLFKEQICLLFSLK